MSHRIVRLFAVTMALSLAPLSAIAANLPRYKAPSYVAPSISTWSGLYLGLNAGYGFGKSDWDLPVSTKPKGGLFGVTGGYNFQTGSWVWGLETDFGYSGMKDTSACGAGSCETKNTWLGTGRGRLGYAGWQNWMPYLTGGLAYGNIKASNTAFSSASDTRFGYAVGAGVEYMMFGNWSVKAEYLYVDLGKFDCAAACGAVTPDNVKFHANIIRAGLNYRF